MTFKFPNAAVTCWCGWKGDFPVACRHRIRKTTGRSWMWSDAASWMEREREPNSQSYVRYSSNIWPQVCASAVNCCNNSASAFFQLLLCRPSNLSAAGRPLQTRLAGSPPVSCLSIYSTHLPLGADQGSNTYLNGFRYWTMNCAQTLPKRGAWAAWTEEYFPVRYIVFPFFIIIIIFMAYTVICLEVSQQHWYYSWLMWNQCKRCRLN